MDHGSPNGAKASARRVAVISHRTHVGLQPENSRAGIEAAIASAVDGVEMDVRATRDGHLVLMHDRSLARTLGDPRHVDAVDYAKLHTLAPVDIPATTVDEALSVRACSAP